MEIMEVDDEIRAMINKGASVEELRERASAKGMRFLSQSALRNVLAGVTSVDEMLGLSVQRD